MEQTPEWEMICSLYEIIDELETDAQQEFIKSLYNNLDPYQPFEEQVEGLEESVEKQTKWLYSLYEKYVEGDDESAKEVWED